MIYRQWHSSVPFSFSISKTQNSYLHKENTIGADNVSTRKMKFNAKSQCMMKYAPGIQK